MDSTYRYLEKLGEFIGSPLGLVALAAGLGIAILAQRQNRAFELGFGALLYASCFSAADRYYFENTLTQPFELIKMNSRVLFALLLLASGLAAYALTRKTSMPKRLSYTPYFLLAFQVIYACRIISVGLVSRGLLSLLIFILCFVIFYRQLPRLRLSPQSSLSVVVVIGLALNAFLLTNLMQRVVNPSGVLHAGRMYGATHNPQQLAMLMGLTLLTNSYLVRVFSLRSPWGKAALAGCIGAVLVIGMTGSRTGMLISASGLIAFLGRSMPERVYAAAGFGAVALLVALLARDFSNITDHRMTSLKDNRSEIWREEFQGMMDNPVFGEIRLTGVRGGTGANDQIKIRENSFLTAGHLTGVGGFLLLSAWAFTFLRELHSLRAKHQSLLIDYSFGFGVSVVIGSVFEGYLLSVTGPLIILIYTISVCVAWERDRFMIPSQQAAHRFARTSPVAV